MKNTMVVLSTLALVILALSFASATPVAAQGNKVLDFNETFDIPLNNLDNPCTGIADDVDLDTTWHVQGKIIANDNNLHFIVEINGHGSGYDADGLQYIGNAAGHLSLKIPDGPLTAGVNLLLISQGGTDNFVVNFTLHVSPNGSVSLNLADSICRG